MLLKTGNSLRAIMKPNNHAGLAHAWYFCKMTYNESVIPSRFQMGFG
jgi:hypothetical protein